MLLHIINPATYQVYARQSLIKKFMLAIEKDSHLCTSLAASRDTGYLIRFLRAGKWEVETALEVLRSYSSLGQDYTEYLSRAIPTK